MNITFGVFNAVKGKREAHMASLFYVYKTVIIKNAMVIASKSQANFINENAIVLVKKVKQPSTGKLNNPK